MLGFQRLGKPDLAAALQKAMGLLGDPYPREREERDDRLTALGSAKGGSTESFSIIPKWVAEKAGITSSENRFEEMDGVLGGAGDDLEELMDEYAAAKAG